MTDQPNQTTAPVPPTRVGDTIYRFDINHRIYRQTGRLFGGGPIYEKHFIPYKITGEVAQSWVLDLPGHRVGKRTLLSPGPGKAWFTAQQMADDVWANEHRHKVIDLLRRADVAQLRQIAGILGYTPEKTD